MKRFKLAALIILMCIICIGFVRCNNAAAPGSGGAAVNNEIITIPKGVAP